MTLLLGLDTGGTFTDAALLETPEDGGQARVVAKAKALTTRQDLAIGIAEATHKVVDGQQYDPAAIGMVSLSTTLATNALVEGQGGRVALIAIGFSERDLNNAGLREALGNDPVVLLEGGHTTHGQEAKPLALEPLVKQVREIADSVTGFAVAGYFAVRNPAHELAVRDYLIENTGKAVTCSHELSANLNGPKRALTTILNARLVPLITRLIKATRDTLVAVGIEAPLMVVRGDGALVSAAFASRRPIETILSGPAASLVGARYLTGADNAFVCDIGGTTSDVALLENGMPMLDQEGALVGGYRTMVEAVAMHTFGLGGDSEVGIGGTALEPKLTLGPRRLVPVSLIAVDHTADVMAALSRQTKSPLNGRHDGRFAFRSGAGIEAGLSENEARLFAKITDVPLALDELLQGNSQAAALSKLVGRGLVMVAGLTPSDAMHALGAHSIWNREAAVAALHLFARQRDGSGQRIGSDPLEMAKRIVESVQRRSAEVVLETAFSADGRDGKNLVSHELVQQSLDARASSGYSTGRVGLSVMLDRPLIGLGASAFQYHPEAARLLDIAIEVPKDADVANAIGAVVGQVVMRCEVLISQPAEGRYAVVGIDGPFSSESAAFGAAEQLARKNVLERATEAGANEVEVNLQTVEKRANIESSDMLVEAKVVATATGRPAIAVR